MKMKLLLSLLLLIVIVLSFKKLISNTPYLEGLCGNYSLTYSKVKDIFSESDVSGMILAYNVAHERDLITNC